jgi:hypothetical protein
VKPNIPLTRPLSPKWGRGDGGDPAPRSCPWAGHRLNRSFGLTRGSLKARMKVAVGALAQGEGTDSGLTMAYAQDDGFFERDRDGGSEGTEPR